MATPPTHILMQATYVKENNLPKALAVLQGKSVAYYATELPAFDTLLHIQTERAQVQIHAIQNRNYRGAPNAVFSYWNDELGVGFAYWIESNIPGG